MRMKARKELDKWEGRIKNCEREAEKRRAPRLTMNVVMQNRASFSTGEILKTLPWRALQKVKKCI